MSRSGPHRVYRRPPLVRDVGHEDPRHCHRDGDGWVAYVRLEDPPGLSPITTVGRFDTVEAAQVAQRALPPARYEVGGLRKIAKTPYPAPSRALFGITPGDGALESVVGEALFGGWWSFVHWSPSLAARHRARAKAVPAIQATPPTMIEVLVDMAVIGRSRCQSLSGCGSFKGAVNAVRRGKVGPRVHGKFTGRSLAA